MSKMIKFGEDVNGYEIPVLNERESCNNYWGLIGHRKSFST